MRWPVSARTLDTVYDLLRVEREDGERRRLEANARCDALLDLLKAERAEADQRHRDANARYDALLDKYHALRLVGGTAPQPAAERRDDPVSQAIIAKARGNPALYAHYATYVATQRAQRIPEDSIAQSILSGVDDDLGVPL